MKIALLGLLCLGACAVPPPPTPDLLELAKEYPSYGKVDDRKRWAPAMCASPPEPMRRTSASTDLATHGRKSYFLYAKDRAAYLAGKEQPIGQVLVKESWIPSCGFMPGPLFMMIKSGGADSDEGWIYATLTSDGKSVTGSGRMESCMKCHRDAPRDRIFGLPAVAAVSTP